MDKEYQNLKEELISLAEESLLFSKSPEKLIEFKKALLSLEYEKGVEKLIKELIKVFKEEKNLSS